MSKSNEPIKKIRGSFYKDKKLPEGTQGRLDRIMFNGRFSLNGQEYKSSILKEDPYKYRNFHQASPEYARIVLVEETEKQTKTKMNEKLSNWAKNNMDFAAGPIGQYVTDLQNKFLEKRMLLKENNEKAKISIYTDKVGEVSFIFEMPYNVIMMDEVDDKSVPIIIGDKENPAIIYRGGIQAKMVNDEVVSSLIRDEAEWLNSDLEAAFYYFDKKYKRGTRPNTDELHSRFSHLKEKVSAEIRDNDSQSLFDYEITHLNNLLQNTYRPNIQDISKEVTMLEKQLESQARLEKGIQALREDYGGFRKNIVKNSKKVNWLQRAVHFFVPRKEGAQSTTHLKKVIKEIENEMKKNPIKADYAKLKNKLVKTLEKFISKRGELYNPKFPNGKALKVVFKKGIDKINHFFSQDYTYNPSVTEKKKVAASSENKYTKKM